MIHPLVLCSPFAYRTYQKPLGYAGDYEMVNMILRDPCEGSSLFAKTVNVWFLAQAPAEAHRNRITYLTDKLDKEVRRASSLNPTAKVMSMGCGPAGEIQEFILQNDLCDRTEFTLLDLNEETLQHTGETLENIKSQRNAKTPIHLIKRSVHQILKSASRGSDKVDHYDFIYCAGLFDYLSDRIAIYARGIMQNYYDYKKHFILYVDDEEKSLKYLTKAFEDTFRFLTAPNAEEGYRLLENHRDEIDILLTDQRMPGETGVQLLEKSRHISPRLVRILVTAYTDLDATIAAVNSGQFTSTSPSHGKCANGK